MANLTKERARKPLIKDGEAFSRFSWKFEGGFFLLDIVDTADKMTAYTVELDRKEVMRFVRFVLERIE